MGSSCECCTREWDGTSQPAQRAPGQSIYASRQDPLDQLAGISPEIYTSFTWKRRHELLRALLRQAQAKGVRLCGYMWGSDVVEVLGGSGESHDVHRFIHYSSSIKLTRALPPIPQRVARERNRRTLASLQLCRAGFHRSGRQATDQN
jgi:hypothetical protein